MQDDISSMIEIENRARDLVRQFQDVDPLVATISLRRAASAIDETYVDVNRHRVLKPGKLRGETREPTVYKSSEE